MTVTDTKKAAFLLCRLFQILFRSGLSQSLLKIHFTAAPLYYRKPLSGRSADFLVRYLLPAVYRPIRHKYTDYCIRLRFNDKSGMFRIGFCLKRNQIVRIGLQPGQPVYDKFVSLPACKPQFCKRPFQELCGILSCNAKSFRKIIFTV